MTQKDLIRQEIERRIAGSDDAYARALKGILSFIDLLPEETPSEYLEEEAKKYRFFDFGTPDEIAQTAFKAGAEWQKKKAGRGYDSRDLYEAYEQGRFEQKEQLMKEAVEGEAEELYNEGGEIHCVVGVGTYFKPGDKVKVIKI